MQALSLPASAGIRWIRIGFALFRRQPFAIMTLVLAFFFASFLLLTIPIIGLMIALVLIPGFSAAFMYAARDIEHGQLVLPTLLVAPFRKNRETAQRLLALGAAYAVTMALAQLFVAMLDEGELSRAISEGLLFKDEVELPTSLQITMLAAVALQIVVTAVYWFAPVLVVWHDVPPMKAIFFSIVAVWRSSTAFLVFGVALLLLTLLSQASVSFVLTMIGLSAPLQIFFVMPLTVALIALFYCAAYASYREAFGLTDEPAHVDSAA